MTVLANAMGIEQSKMFLNEVVEGSVKLNGGASAPTDEEASALQ